MTTRQALTAALTILSRTDQLVEAGFTRDQANDGARQGRAADPRGGGPMSTPHVTVWHLVGVVALVVGVVVALWLSLWIGGRK